MALDNMAADWFRKLGADFIFDFGLGNAERQGN